MTTKYYNDCVQTITGDVTTKIDTIALPEGASTATKQDSTIAQLQIIATQLQSLATAAKQDTQSTTLSAIVSALTGASTSGKQDTQTTALNSIITALAGLATSSKQDTQATTLASILTAFTGLSTASNQSTELTTLTALVTALNALTARYTATTAAITISPAITVNPNNVKLIDTNLNRKGLYIYNNSANSIYISYGTAANSANNMTQIIATFATFIIPTPVYLGPIYGTRNSGSGSALITELT